MKSKRRRAVLANKQARKREAMSRPKRKSNYARKAEYLRRNGGFGFDYPSKPWKAT